MEQEYITPDPAYVKGFNDGYIIAEHKPELATQLKSLQQDGPWFEGFRDGHSAFRQEMIQEMTTEMMDWDMPGPPEENDKSHDKDHDRDER